MAAISQQSSLQGPFLRLRAEMVHEIAGHMDLEEFKSLRLSCRQLENYSAHAFLFFFEVVTVKINSQGLEKLQRISGLRSLASRVEHIYFEARHYAGGDLQQLAVEFLPRYTPVQPQANSSSRVTYRYTMGLMLAFLSLPSLASITILESFEKLRHRSDILHDYARRNPFFSCILEVITVAANGANVQLEGLFLDSIFATQLTVSHPRLNSIIRLHNNITSHLRLLHLFIGDLEEPPSLGWLSVRQLTSILSEAPLLEDLKFTSKMKDHPKPYLKIPWRHLPALPNLKCFSLENMWADINDLCMFLHNHRSTLRALSITDCARRKSRGTWRDLFMLLHDELALAHFNFKIRDNISPTV